MPKHKHPMAKLSCLVLLAASVCAARPAGAGGERETIDGLLVNQTVTVAGQEFNAAFAALWSDRPGVQDYALAIRERPSPGRGTTIEVMHSNRPLFRAWLPPSRQQLRALAEQAVDAAYQAAVAAQVGQLVRDEDLAPDEIQ